MKNVLSGTPHKQMLVSNYEKTKIMRMWEKSNGAIEWVLFALPSTLYENLAKIPSFEQRAKKKDECTLIRACICETWKNSKVTMRKMWEYFVSSASFRLFKASSNYVALPPLSYATSQGGAI